MRRIVRRALVRDRAGRMLSVRSERLTDDGSGALQQTSEVTAGACSGCGRPVTDISELRGACDGCHARGCCVHCLGRCQVCSRRLCGGCRRGFAGPPPLTVCAACRERLAHRQALQDQRAAFEQELARHRLFHQDQALRLNCERTRLMAEIQAARLGLLPRRWWPLWALGRVLATLIKGVRYAWRALRGRPAGRGVRAPR